jgi:hypothetical protein
VPNLAEWTQRGYRPLLTKHMQPRLGFYRLREVGPEVIADFRADLEAAGVGRHAVRVSIGPARARGAAGPRGPSRRP